MFDVETKKIETLVANSANDAFSEWSPEGNAFLYRSSVNDSITNFYKKVMDRLTTSFICFIDIYVVIYK